MLRLRASSLRKPTHRAMSSLARRTLNPPSSTGYAIVLLVKWLSSRRISCCSTFDAALPVPPRPVVQFANSSGVDPLSLGRSGSAPSVSSVATAMEHRLRTARCRAVTPPVAVASMSAPSSTSSRIAAHCWSGFQWGVSGPPEVAGCSGCARRRFVARTPAPRSTNCRIVASTYAHAATCKAVSPA